MSLPVGGRAARRRAVVRRRLALGAGTVLGVAAIGGLALAVSGGDDEPTRAKSAPASASSSTSTSTAVTTTTVVPRSSNPVVALAQQYDGYYEGTYTNTTFGNEGATTLLLRIDPNAGTLTSESTFDGDVLGGGAKKVRRFDATIQLGDPTAPFATQTEDFGEVVGRITPDLSLVLTAADVPDPKVQSFELTGRLRDDLSGFDATFHVVFEDGSTADGMLTVTCSPNRQRPSEVRTLCTASA